MEILDMIQKLTENLKAHVDNYGCVVMHPSTAEDLLAYYLGVKVSIQHVCPRNKVYLVNDQDLARNLWKPEDSV